MKKEEMLSATLIDRTDGKRMAHCFGIRVRVVRCDKEKGTVTVEGSYGESTLQVTDPQGRGSISTDNLALEPGQECWLELSALRVVKTEPKESDAAPN